MSREILLEVKGLQKTFPGVKALKGVDFSVARGEVHGLMGENGAGKSTLIKVLTGVYAKDAGKGSMLFDGQKINPHSTLEAQNVGISTIYQELNLSPFQTVYENVYLGREEKKALGLLNRKQMIEKAKSLLADMGLNIDVTMPLQHYGTAVQQMVAIARAISIQAKLVIMDEPTSSLDQKEVAVLFRVIEHLKEKGISIIFISHRLDEVFSICQHITVLKDGETVGDYPISELNPLKLVSLMIGREAKKMERTKGEYSFSESPELVKMVNIRQGMRLHGLGLEIKQGEIVGLAGLLGSGRTELARVLFGETMPDSGRIFLLEKPTHIQNPSQAIRLGMGFCTEDRKVEGIVSELSVKENMTLALLPKISRFGVISQKKERELADFYIQKLRIKTPSANQQIRFLSGGNQQKVLLARWMCMNPKLIIMDEPTRGIDVGAKSEIEALIQELSDNGVSILMISSEMDELQRNCDRVVVVRDGRSLKTLTGKDIEPEIFMKTIAAGSQGSEEEVKV